MGTAGSGITSIARSVAGNKKGLFNILVTFCGCTVAGSDMTDLPVARQMYKLKQERDKLMADLSDLQAEYSSISSVLRGKEWSDIAAKRLGCDTTALSEEVKMAMSSPGNMESVEARILREYGSLSEQNGRTKDEINRKKGALLVL